MPTIHYRPLPEHNDVHQEPDWLWVKSERHSAWLGDQHFIEVYDRTVEVGKHYLYQIGEMPFWKVVEIHDELVDGEAPEYIDDVENPMQKVTVELVYEPGNDEPIPTDPLEDTIPRFLLETERTPASSNADLGMIPPFVEAPPVPFKESVE